jgi:hypothetical protein
MLLQYIRFRQLGQVVRGHSHVGGDDPVWRSESVGERTNGACTSDGGGLSVAAGEGCGNAGEQQIEEAVQFGGAVVGS